MHLYSSNQKHLYWFNSFNNKHCIFDFYYFFYLYIFFYNIKKKIHIFLFYIFHISVDVFHFVNRLLHAQKY